GRRGDFCWSALGLGDPRLGFCKPLVGSSNLSPGTVLCADLAVYGARRGIETNGSFSEGAVRLWQSWGSQGPIAPPMPRVAPARTRSRLDARLARSTRDLRGLCRLLSHHSVRSTVGDTAFLTSRTSLAQPRDDSACPGELMFIICGVWRMAATAHRFECRIDLAEGILRHGDVFPPVSKNDQRYTLVAKAAGPVKRHALAGPFLQRLVKGDNGLFEVHRPALALPDDLKRGAQVVLGLGPVERHALAGPFLQHLAICNDSLFEF